MFLLLLQSIELFLTDWYEHVLASLEDLLLKRLINLNLQQRVVIIKLLG